MKDVPVPEAKSLAGEATVFGLFIVKQCSIRQQDQFGLVSTASDSGKLIQKTLTESLGRFIQIEMSSYLFTSSHLM